MSDQLPTKERLARTLEAEGVAFLAAAARRGLYDDIESPLPTPKIELVRQLRSLDGAKVELVNRILSGEFDNTHEEWIESGW